MLVLRSSFDALFYSYKRKGADFYVFAPDIW